ncbi:AraC family transcriptional regulator [Nocardia sp. KC 131]|uniref:AraC family transcriptional regulator n=1 Tax=Nocardia arseniciresistens TaxID=3392119 RepID=UPI00398E43DA
MTGAELMSQAFESDTEDPNGSWEEYLREMQGSVGLGFRNEVFKSSAFAQGVGPFQIVEFTTTAVDYRRSRLDIKRDDDDPSYRLLIPLRGTFRFEQGEHREVFAPGKVGFFRWHHGLFMTHDSPITALIMTVPADQVNSVWAAKTPLALDEKRPLVRHLATQVRSILEIKDWTAGDFTVACSGALGNINGAINPYPDIKPGKRAKVAEKARLLIEQHANDRDLTTEAVAAMMGIHARTLYRAMEDIGYPPPMEMLNAIRIERAHRRISSDRGLTSEEIKGLADELGFASSRSFRESYKERYGRTPAETHEVLFIR